MTSITTRCCVVGGGPAGMILGVLLARAGVDVVVLEKHADFLRDFRGDTIHPSTLELMYELGVLGEFLRLPHERVSILRAQVSDSMIPIADFSHLPTRCKFIALMPQWDFLNFLATQGSRYPTFHLRQSTDVTGLIEEGDRVVGVRATGPEGEIAVRADLVVGADGRHSTVRERAGLHVQELGAPMDVLWFRISRKASDPEGTMGRFDTGHILVMLNRGSYWQFGYVIAKGSAEANRNRGIEAFRKDIAALAPFAADRQEEIRTWDDVKLLTVQVDRLLHWYRPGLLCIGDAAHAMSPVGGVGVNLAVQDGVAAANLLAKPLRDGRLTTEDLRRVQDRRLLPTKLVQAGQVLVQKQIVGKVLGRGDSIKPPLPLRLFARFPILRRIPARLIGIGVRPEHICTPVIN